MDLSPVHTLSQIRSTLSNNISRDAASRRRSVEVNVTRVPSPRGVHTLSTTDTDINNNHTRILLHPEPTARTSSATMSFFETLSTIPRVSALFAIIQILVYLFKDNFNITTEQEVCVSWKTVIQDGEICRLLYAQFFNFGRVFVFFNTVSLMAIGRYLEKKIQKLAYLLIICLMSFVSNLFFVFLSDIFCSGPVNTLSVGFGTTIFALRMIHIFTMDSEANNGKGDPNLILGFIPVHLPTSISPWQPLLETIFFDVVIIGRCIAANISGILAGLLFPYLVKRFRPYIMLPRAPPPPPPRTRSRHTVSRRFSDTTNNNLAVPFNNNLQHFHNS